jgi:hypothetical protein
MLKAVRFDENQHKQLLDFIDFYQDDKGRRNDSEAIRYLMQKGFEAITNEQKQPQPIEANIPMKPEPVSVDTLKKEVISELAGLIPKDQVQPDMEQIKKEFYNQVLSEVNEKTMNSLNSILDKLTNFQPVVMQQTVVPAPVVSTPITPTIQNTPVPQIEEVKQEELIPVKKIEIPSDIDGLLGNILGNANR